LRGDCLALDSRVDFTGSADFLVEVVTSFGTSIVILALGFLSITFLVADLSNAFSLSRLLAGFFQALTYF
jgi:hypothetical protein